MKGYPPGYPATEQQQATADRHAARRNGKPPTPADIARIETAMRRRGGPSEVEERRPAAFPLDQTRKAQLFDQRRIERQRLLARRRDRADARAARLAEAGGE